jgi:hypothetical protein
VKDEKMPVATGQVKKEVTYTTILPGAQDPDQKQRRKRPPIWEFLSQIPAEDWAKGRYVGYLYRYDPQTEKRKAVEKLIEPIDVFMIKRRFGGGKFYIMIHEDAQLIYNEDFEIEGDPIVGGAAQPSSQQNGNSSGNPMIEAMRMAMNPELMRSMIEMFKMASQESMLMLRAQMPVAQDPLQTLRNAKEILGIGTAAPNPMDEMMKQFMQAMITKMLNPPETNSFKETMGLVNEIKSSGLFGPPARTDVGTMLVANLPMIADRFVNGLHEYRLQAEATERTIRLQQGQMHPNDPKTINIDPGAPANQPAAQPSAAPPAATAQTVSPEVAQQIIVASHLQRLVAGIKQPDSTGENMYDYLLNAWPEVLAEMEKYSKDQLLALFRSSQMQQQFFGNTILSEVGNDPRLPKMIEDFLKIAKENAPKPSATV